MGADTVDGGSETETAAYLRYLALLDERAGLHDDLQARAADIEAESRAAVDAAASAERQVSDSIRDVERKIDALRPRVRRIAAQAGSAAAPGRAPATPDSLAACTSLAQAIEVDLRSAESSWAWIDRQRSQAASGRTPPPASPSSLDPAPGSSGASAEPAHRPGLRSSILIVLVLVVLAALVAVLVF